MGEKELGVERGKKSGGKGKNEEACIESSFSLFVFATASSATAAEARKGRWELSYKTQLKKTRLLCPYSHAQPDAIPL